MLYYIYTYILHKNIRNENNVTRYHLKINIYLLIYLILHTCTLIVRSKYMLQRSHEDINICQIPPMPPLFLPFAWDSVIINKWLTRFRICMLRHHQLMDLHANKSLFQKQCLSPIISKECWWFNCKQGVTSWIAVCNYIHPSFSAREK